MAVSETLKKSTEMASLALPLSTDCYSILEGH